ncbi:hypothetical protein MAHJHV57_54450 [Mycobacterium avium subsp. hominissuis]
MSVAMARRSSRLDTPPEAITGRGVEGAIVGKALYAGRFTLPQALAAVAE